MGGCMREQFSKSFSQHSYAKFTKSIVATDQKFWGNGVQVIFKWIFLLEKTFQLLLKQWATFL
jgi:hypothetical protein